MDHYSYIPTNYHMLFWKDTPNIFDKHGAYREKNREHDLQNGALAELEQGH